MNALAEFKQQLAGELHAHALSLPAPQETGRPARSRAVRRRVTFTVAVAAAAAAVAVALPLSSAKPGTSQAAPAPRGASATAAAPTPQHTADFSHIDIVTADYAVQSKPGGNVTIQLFSLRGQAGLQAALNKAGIPAQVMVASASCHETGTAASSGPSGGTATLDRLRKVSPPAAPGSYDAVHGIYTIYPAAMEPGDHLLFIAPSGSTSLSYLMVELVRFVPRCIAPNMNPIP